MRNFIIFRVVVVCRTFVLTAFPAYWTYFGYFIAAPTIGFPSKQGQYTLQFTIGVKKNNMNELNWTLKNSQNQKKIV
jgi:hypothetical protein